jgi:hypothetical protein
MADLIAEQFQDISHVTSFLHQFYHIKINNNTLLTIIYKRNQTLSHE